MATDPTSWATMYTGLKELRDQKEVLFLSKLIAELGAKRSAVAADMAAQRVREILLAKKDNGSWEKASVLSLTSTGLPAGQALPDTAFQI